MDRKVESSFVFYSNLFCVLGAVGTLAFAREDPSCATASCEWAFAQTRSLGTLFGLSVFLRFCNLFYDDACDCSFLGFVAGTEIGMGYLLLDADQEIRSTLQKDRMETVTLLLPEDTWLRFSEDEARKLPKRIPQLLRTYGKFLTAQKRLGKNAGRTLYQPSPGKSKMKRINVRLSPGSWTLFGALAQAHGVSRCFLFNYLLCLDLAGVGDSILYTVNAGVPTFHTKYSYILHLDLPNNGVIRKLHCEPDSLFYTLDYRDWYPD